jgi:secreted PhoX family phosphatase
MGHASFQLNRRATEDRGDGCFYRFTPNRYPDLSAGLLEVALLDDAGKVDWAEVPDPRGGAANPTRHQVPGAARFDGGEGLWYDRRVVYFTTKGDDRVWAYHVTDSRLEVLYDAAAVGPDAPLTGVDNITVSPSGDIYVCEDGRDHDICLITPDFEISRFLKLHPEVHSGPPPGSPVAGNELVGVVFDPSGTRMYFGAQRSFAFGVDELPRGVVYEVSGPFRQAARSSTLF